MASSILVESLHTIFEQAFSILLYKSAVGLELYYFNSKNRSIESKVLAHEIAQLLKSRKESIDTFWTKLYIDTVVSTHDFAVFADKSFFEKNHNSISPTIKENISWEKISALIAHTYLVVKECIKQGYDLHAEFHIRYLTEYITSRLQSWIHKQGGIEQYFTLLYSRKKRNCLCRFLQCLCISTRFIYCTLL